MNSMSSKKPGVQKAQKRLTSFFRSKVKSATSNSPVPRSTTETENAFPVSAVNIVHDPKTQTQQSVIQKDRQSSASPPESQAAKTSEFFSSSQPRPSKRARTEPADDFQILEDDPAMENAPMEGSSKDSLRESLGNGSSFPKHQEELHQRFQVSTLPAEPQC